MKTMIFAAGLGTRLKPLTDTLPKALVPVAGKPLLKHVISYLQAAGLNDFVINVHHFADKIVDYISGQEKFGARVAVSDESGKLLDTGGGILKARELLMEGESADGFFLVHNVDIVSDLDVRKFVDSYRGGALAVLLVSERRTQRYLLFDDDMRLVGWTNISTGEVRSPFPALDVTKCRMLAFSGIHLISNGVFDVMEDESMGERFPIMDFYLKVCDRYPIYGYVPERLNLVDVGKLDTLARAEDFMLRLRRNCPEGSEA